MEREPKYKIGEKVWFVAENEHVCYGVINKIIPVNYNFKYNIKMVLNSIGEVVKNNIDEKNVIGDFDVSAIEVIIKGVDMEYVKRMDERILKNLFNDGVKITCLKEK